MKKILSLLAILLLIGGCGKEKTSLEKFQDYLVKKYQFKCEEKLCTSSSSVANVQKNKNEINFEANTYMHSTTGISNITSKTITYNWKDKTATGELKEISIEVTATYDFNTTNFECHSKFYNQGYVDNKCDEIKKDLEDLKANFYQLVDDSKSGFLEE